MTIYYQHSLIFQVIVKLLNDTNQIKNIILLIYHIIQLLYRLQICVIIIIYFVVCCYYEFMNL